MSWLLTVMFLTFIFNNPSDASQHEKEPPSAVIVGTVYCETCFLQDFSKASHFISGATVAVACKDAGSGPSFLEEVKTNKHGEFRVHLPVYISKHLKKIKGCSVKLIRSSEPYCAVASTATSSSLHLSSRKQGTHIYSAGFFTFKPLKQPGVCNQKPSVPNPKGLNSVKFFMNNLDDPTFAPPTEDPPTPILPPVDQNQFPRFPQLHKLPPLPQLPSVPPPGSPSTTRTSEQNVPSSPKLPPHPSIPPGKKNPTLKGSSRLTEPSDEKIEEKQLFTPATPLLPLPQNPFTPPSILPPNPFTPPSILPPNPFTPPSILPPILPSPPPSIFPPILPSPPPSILPPILPSPPRSLFPPFFPSPPSPPFISFPPIPGLFPSPPPPPPPSLRFPLPPFPFLPPGFPGVPPAATTTTTTVPPSQDTSP